MFFSLREEEREDFDTSTESKEIEQKELDQDTVTEDEDDPGSHKRGRRGNREVSWGLACLFLIYKELYNLAILKYV